MRIFIWFFLVLGLALPEMAIAQNPLEQARVLRKQAAALENNGDFAGASKAFERALLLQPGHRSYWLNLALLAEKSGHRANAIGWLEKFTQAGLYFPPQRLANALGVAMDDADYAAVLRALDHNNSPLGQTSIRARVAANDVLVEGIALDPKSGRTFVSTIVGRSILMAEENGEFTNFVHDDPRLRSLFSLAIDRRRNLLWVTSGTIENTPLDEGESPASGLYAFDLDTGKSAHAFDMSEHAKMLGDLTLGADGCLYASDGLGGAVFRFSANGRRWKKLETGNVFSSPQGIAFLGDSMFVADYSTGLVRVDQKQKTAQLLPAPLNTSLIGLDGLIAHKGKLIGIQNGASPMRIVQITLSEDQSAIAAVDVLLQNDKNMEDPTQGVIENDNLHFIGNAQWARFPTDGSAPKTPREPTRILTLPLE